MGKTPIKLIILFLALCGNLFAAQNVQVTGTGGVLLFPAASLFRSANSIVSLSGTEALTNKTVNGNTITSGTGTLTLGGFTLGIVQSGTLGTAAYAATGAFDASGVAASAQAFSIQRANHTGTQPYTTITGLGDVATLNININGAGFPEPFSVATFASNGMLDGGNWYIDIYGGIKGVGGIYFDLSPNNSVAPLLTSGTALALTGTIPATQVADGSVSDAEFQYLDGLTSNVQTQLNGKANLSGTNTYSIIGVSGTATYSISGGVNESQGFANQSYQEPLVIVNADAANALAIQNNHTGGYSAMACRDSNGEEHFATGYGNSASHPIFRGASYAETWSLSGAPPPYRITVDGDYGPIGSGFRFYNRQSFEPTGAIKFWRLIPWGTTQEAGLVFDGTTGRLGVNQSVTPEQPLDVLGTAVFGGSTGGGVTRSLTFGGGYALYVTTPQDSATNGNNPGSIARFVRDGVGKTDLQWNGTGSTRRLDFIDTDNSSIVPLSLSMAGTGNIAVSGTTITNGLSVSGTGTSTFAGNLSVSGTLTASAVSLGIIRLSGTLSSGVATFTNAAITGNHPWAQNTQAGITNLGALSVTVSGSTATVSSSTVLSAGTVDLFVIPGI